MATAPDTAEFVIAKIEAQRASTLIQVAAVLGAAACIALAAGLQTPINTQRKELELVLHSNIYKELPPEYAWVSAAGGAFRGLMADVLWIRADRLKEEGKYYEAHQLAEWICTLFPRFPQVWSFQAWNMSYNISVATHTPQERWQWVYNGIRLLRDKGIPNNERIVPLYHQLAWTWFHKVGDRSDDFHWIYKRVWAATMETLLGPPPVGVPDAEAVEWFRPVAEAPTTLAGLLNESPGAAALIDELDSLGIDVNVGTSNQRVYHPLEERFFRPYTAWTVEKTLLGLRSETAEREPQDPRLVAFFEKHAESDNFADLLAYLRAKVLREQYKMDPEFMFELTGQLGTENPVPIDWRTPWSQSLYWATYGTARGRELRRAKQFDLLNTDRIMLFSLATMTKAGRYIFRINLDDPMASFLNVMPDLRYLEAMHNKYLEYGQKHAEEGEDVGQTAGETLRSGHVNHLHNGIVALYLSGRKDEARKYLDYLAINYKDLYEGTVQEQYLQSLDDFVRSQLKDMSESYNDAIMLIYSLLTDGYMSLAAGYGEEFAAALNNAQYVYNVYQREAGDDIQGRRTLPPFSRMRADALGYFVSQQEFPLPLRSIAWNLEADQIKRQCYDDVIGDLAVQCERGGFDVARAFPEPEGMAQWRIDNPRPDQPEDVARRAREARQN
jgi:hypothetical protein